MADLAPDKTAFAILVQALRPYLREVVFVGGWAHRLFHFHEFADPAGYLPLATDDADVAVPTRLAVSGKTIRALLTEAGFVEKIVGDERPPVTEYSWNVERDGAFVVEFLTPQTGSEYRRNGMRDVTVAVAGVTAQKLRYLDVLLVDPWSVAVGRDCGFPVEEAIGVRIANPVTYVMHKVLVLPERDRKKEKDLLYVHDTIELFGAVLPKLNDTWVRVSSEIGPKRVRELERLRGQFFTTGTDVNRGAPAIARASGRPNPPSADLIVRRCRDGLAAIFGA